MAVEIAGNIRRQIFDRAGDLFGGAIAVRGYKIVLSPRTLRVRARGRIRIGIALVHRSRFSSRISGLVRTWRRHGHGRPRHVRRHRCSICRAIRGSAVGRRVSARPGAPLSSSARRLPDHDRMAATRTLPSSALTRRGSRSWATAAGEESRQRLHSRCVTGDCRRCELKC